MARACKNDLNDILSQETTALQLSLDIATGRVKSSPEPTSVTLPAPEVRRLSEAKLKKKKIKGPTSCALRLVLPWQPSSQVRALPTAIHARARTMHASLRGGHLGLVEDRFSSLYLYSTLERIRRTHLGVASILDWFYNFDRI